MNLYFDNDNRVNLDHIIEIREVRPYQQLKSYYNVDHAVFLKTVQYDEPGIYLIEVSKLTHQWTAKNQFSNSFNIFNNLPYHVISAVRMKVLRIVILSIVEGDNFVKPFWDGFRSLTDSIKSLGLPSMSVLVISANLRANEEYQDWCVKNNQEPIVEIIGAIEGPSSNIRQDYRITEKIDLEDCFAYNSLNHANRQSRTEHLFVLAEKNILGQGLVSGGAHFADQGIHNPIFLDVDEDYYRKILEGKYPRFVDLTIDCFKNSSLGNVINLEIYKKSMLSVITETYFQEPGLYFSEKIFKPICVGHPQMVLGQHGYISYFKQELGIDLCFEGIDFSFDFEKNPKYRFHAFHDSLIEWINLGKNQRQKLFVSWRDKLEKNFKILKSIDFKNIITTKMINSTLRYFGNH